MNTHDKAQLVEEQCVEVGAAEAVMAVVKLGAGQLDVGGGAESLLEARFTYDDPDLKPEVCYAVDAGQGRLDVTHAVQRGISCSRRNQDWRLRFNDTIPLDLSLSVGAGSVALDGGTLNLTDFTVQMGSGRITAAMNGTLSQLERVKLNAASGQLALNMAGEYPALRTLELGTASGKHDLTLTGTFPALEKLTIGSANGTINLALAGHYDTLKKVEVNTANGVINLDVTEARQDLEVAFSCISGKVVVRVPDGIGVRIYHSSISGKVVAEGFRRKNGHYVNAAYGEAEVTLNLTVSSINSRVEVQPVEATSVYKDER